MTFLALSGCGWFTGAAEPTSLGGPPVDTDATETGAPPDETGDSTVDTDVADTDAPVDTDEPIDTGVSGGTTCWMVAPKRGGDVALVEVDMTSGAISERMVWSGSGTTSSFHTFGMTRDPTSFTGAASDPGGFALAGYDGNGFRWYRLGLAGTIVPGASTSAGDVSWSGGDYVAAGTSQVSRYASWADLEAGAASADLPIRSAERLTVDGAELYVGWHSTDHIDVYDLGTATMLRSIVLEDWDTWIRGMSVAGGMLHVADDGRQHAEQRIVQFDPMTGKMLGRVYIPWDRARWSHVPTGLWCSTTGL